MPWECLHCGNFNDDLATDECLKCDMEKQAAMNYVVKKRKNQCPKCFHSHFWGVACHCFTEGEADDEDEAQDEQKEEKEEEEEEDDEEEDILGAKVKDTEPVFASTDVEVPEDLPTPPWVKKIGYVRCNCKFGVPQSKRYNKLPPVLVFSGIKIKQFSDVLRQVSEAGEKKQEKLLTKEEEAVLGT
jgi:hypothetical protein